MLLHRFLDPLDRQLLMDDIQAVVKKAPLFQPTMPHSGRPFGVKMTNCGELGWVSDAERGYRYQLTHPVTGEMWPLIPEQTMAIIARVAREIGAATFKPQAVLINRYPRQGSKLGLHIDKDEKVDAPVISLNPEGDCTFECDGKLYELCAGDVFVLMGTRRNALHGVKMTHGPRWNLTARQVY